MVGLEANNDMGNSLSVVMSATLWSAPGLEASPEGGNGGGNLRAPCGACWYTNRGADGLCG